jgi:hypothetical protein
MAGKKHKKNLRCTARSIALRNPAFSSILGLEELERITFLLISQKGRYTMLERLEPGGGAGAYENHWIKKEK